MATYKLLPGINIQFPWSQLIVNGTKTIETRGYAIPTKYIGQELALIETPGKTKLKDKPKKAKIIAIITFGESFQYKTLKSWRLDFSLHKVDPNDSELAFKLEAPKFGWTITKVQILSKPLPAPYPRGIVFASKCKVKV